MTSSTKLLRKKKPDQWTSVQRPCEFGGIPDTTQHEDLHKNRDHDKGTLTMVSCTFVSHALSLAIYKQHMEFR